MYNSTNRRIKDLEAGMGCAVIIGSLVLTAVALTVGSALYYWWGMTMYNWIFK